MKAALYTNIVSPHQMPLARELVKCLQDNYRYIFTEPLHGERIKMGWSDDADRWLLNASAHPDEAERWLQNADVVFSGHRALDLFEKRAAAQQKTYYFSERWFKPMRMALLGGTFKCSLPGWIRMLVPSYWRMAKRMVKWLNNDPNARYFAMGVHAKYDMICLGVRPEKIVDWGYFVVPSQRADNNRTVLQSDELKVLWVGRMIDWKRVDTIVRAVYEMVRRKAKSRISLTLVGDGEEKPKLMRLVAKLFAASSQPISFLPSQPIEKIRELMHSHDVYVLSSDSNEGWGAALNEALEEGMRAIGTFEAGSSATILPRERLFHAGDYKGLAKLLMREAAGELPPCSIGEWTAASAAKRFKELCQ